MILFFFFYDIGGVFLQRSPQFNWKHVGGLQLKTLEKPCTEYFVSLLERLWLVGRTFEWVGKHQLKEQDLSPKSEEAQEAEGLQFLPLRLNASVRIKTTSKSTREGTQGRHWFKIRGTGLALDSAVAQGSWGSTELSSKKFYPSPVPKDRPQKQEKT